MQAEASAEKPAKTLLIDSDASSAARPARVMFSSPDKASSSSDAATRAQDDARRVSRRSSLTDDRVDEVINNLTNMHSMVKLLREGSIDKPDSTRTWDDLANDLEDERTARIIAEEAASTNQQAAEAATTEAAGLRKQLALLTQKLKQHSDRDAAQTQSDSDQHGGSTQLQGINSAVTSYQRQQALDAAEEVSSLQGQIESLTAQLAEEQSRSQLLLQETARSADESATSHASYESTRLQLAELAQQLEQERRKKAAEDGRLSGLSQADPATTAREPVAMQQQLHDLQQQLSEQQKELEHAAGARQLQAASAAEVVVLQEQVASLQQQLITEHANAQHQSAAAAAQTIALNEQVETLQQQLITEHGQTQQQSAVAAAQITALTEQVETLQQLLITEHGQTKQQSAVASAQVNALNEQVETLQQQLITEHGQTQQHAAAARAEVTALHEQVGTLQQQLIMQHGQTQQQSATASAEITALHEQVSTLQQQLITEHRQTEQLSERVRQSEQTATPTQQESTGAASQQVSSLEAQLAEMTQQLQTHREAGQQLTQQLETQERAAQQLAQQQEAAQQLHQQQADSAEEETKKLREQLGALTQQLAVQGQAPNANNAAHTDPQGDATETIERQMSGAAASSSPSAGHSPEHGAETAPGQLPMLQLPDQAKSEGQGRLQSPDQASPGVSAFQVRLHSMLPQLPTLEKLSQLSLEEWWDAVLHEVSALLHTRQWAHAQVGRLEGLESEVDQLQNVLQSVANELESGQQHAQVMQRKVHAAEHSLRKAELRVRSAELRAQSAESELGQLRRLHAHAKRQGSPWKSPGARSNSSRVSQLPGHDSRLLEPEEHSWGTISGLHSSSAQPADGDSSVEIQAALKEADLADNVPPMTDRSDGSSWLGRGKESTATGGRSLQGRSESQSERSNRATQARRREGDKVLPNSSKHLHLPKSPPGSRFSSPARSLPPHLRSYRNFTQTALLAMHSSNSQAEDALAESLGRIPAVRGLPVRRSSSMIRGSKAKGDKLTKGRAVSAQPVLRQSCIPNAALSSGISTPRLTYGMNSAFAAAKQQYLDQGAGQHDEELTEHDRTQIWLKSLTANGAKQATDPKRVDQLVGKFQQLMQQNGLEMPLKRLGPCQYKLGSYRLSLKIGSNKLLVRCGGGYEELLSAVEKMPQVEA